MIRTFSSDVSEDQSHLATMYLSYVLISQQSRTSIYQTTATTTFSQTREQGTDNIKGRQREGCTRIKHFAIEGGGASGGKREKKSFQKWGQSGLIAIISSSTNCTKEPCVFVFWQRVRHSEHLLKPTSGSLKNICAARTEAFPVCFKQKKEPRMCWRDVQEKLSGRRGRDL